MTRLTSLAPCLPALVAASVMGCAGQNGNGSSPGSPPTVTVALPLHEQVTDYHEYTGRTAAVDAVNVQSQVTGYLQKVNFKDGAEVKKDAVLYVIDPGPYQATLNQALAQQRLQEANLKYNQAVYQRDLQLGTGAVAAEQIQKDLAARNTSQASVAAAEAAVAAAQLNVKWTQIHSPITGRMSRTLVTPGNLVVANQTVLTSVVSQDPMYVYFDVDEPTALHVQELIRQGKFKSYREGYKVPVYIGLSTEEGFPHEGHLDFVNNEVNVNTATLQLRALFANPKPPVGTRLLSPGLFVRVRLAVSEPHLALLVDTAAVGTDQTIRYVDVVDPHNKVIQKTVEMGTQHGQLVAITKGLKPDDRVIINGIQRVHQGVTVRPRLVKMRTPQTEGAPPTPPKVNPVPASTP